MMTRGIKSQNRRRDLLHISRLKAFAAWAEAEGYILHPSSPKATYEVLRLEKYDPRGSHPHIVFYRRLLPAGHITVPADGVPLVRRFIKEAGRG